jgi:hypothetical protein
MYTTIWVLNTNSGGGGAAEAARSLLDKVGEPTIHFQNSNSTHRIEGFSDFIHHPDSKELEDKHTTFDISETGSLSVLKWGETPTLLGALERAILNHSSTHVRSTNLYEYLRPGWVNES